MKIRRFLAVALCALLLGFCSCGRTPVEKTFTVTCLAVGKADALVLHTAAGTMVIDTGETEDGERLVSFLQEQGISTVDYLLLTHFDQDHIGGAATLLKQLMVSRVLLSTCPKDSEEYENLQTAMTGCGLTPETVDSDRGFSLDGVRYTVFAPGKKRYTEKESNNASLVVKAVYGENTFLFAADANEERIDELLKVGGLCADFFKVPYHGFYQSNLPKLIDAVQPHYSVICCSDTQGGDTATLKALTQSGSAIYETCNGTVTAVSNGKTITMSKAAAEYE